MLISFGGVDQSNGTGLALEALKRERFHESIVVIGEQHPMRGAIAAACHTEGYECHVQSTRIAEIIDSCDVALGASGASAWERCFLGLPTLMISVADNQAEIAREVAGRGAGLNLGSWPDASADAIAAAIAEIRSRPELVEEMSSSAYAIMEGHVDVADLLIGRSA